MSKPRLIAVDWGTTNFRAYLADATGTVIAQRQSRNGILNVESRAFADVLRAEIGNWVDAHGRLTVLMSGMIGSRQGWVETPYVRCPAGVRDIAAALTALEVDGIGTIHLVPGLDYVPEGEAPDVARGEEAQIIGAISAAPEQNGIFIHPGTHSKWVTVTAGLITEFSTYMTGEVFGALKEHTILGRLMKDGAGSGAGFLRGVKMARRGAPAGGLLHQLFSVRTLGLFDRLPPEELSDYLSGLLIGAEMTAAAQPGQTITILGSQDLTRRYGIAADALELAWTRGPEHAVVAGHLQLAHAAALLERAS